MTQKFREQLNDPELRAVVASMPFSFTGNAPEWFRLRPFLDLLG